MSADSRLAALALTVVAAPAVTFSIVSLALLVRRTPTERVVGRLAFGAVTISFLSSMALSLLWLTGDRDAVDLHIARWFGVGHYGFEVAFLIDRLSMTLLPLVSGVVLVITRFAIPYLHREQGFARFFGQLMLCAVGESVVVLAGSADLLIVGWECVGLSSALLVAFFHERTAPARAAVRVFTTYRLCDVGLLVGAMALHGVAGSSDFTEAFRTTGWPGEAAPLSVFGATALALCFGLAAAGKSAQLPVGTGLPGLWRARRRRARCFTADPSSTRESSSSSVSHRSSSGRRSPRPPWSGSDSSPACTPRWPGGCRPIRRARSPTPR